MLGLQEENACLNKRRIAKWRVGGGEGESPCFSALTLFSQPNCLIIKLEEGI